MQLTKEIFLKPIQTTILAGRKILPENPKSTFKNGENYHTFLVACLGPTQRTSISAPGPCTYKI